MINLIDKPKCKYCGRGVPGITDHDGAHVCYKCFDLGKTKHV